MGYATFFKRTGAFLIDMAILLIICLIPALLLNKVTFAFDDRLFRNMFTSVFFLGWIYFALQESSPRQATIGKKLFSIKVTDSIGQPISFMKASARFFSKYVSVLFYGIGFLMAIWTKQKQALHDKMCKTMVVTAETDTGFFRTNDPAGSEERIKKQLDALDGLRKKGILSEQEYRDSKSKLMSQ